MHDLTSLPACCTPSVAASLAEELYCANLAAGDPVKAGLTWDGKPCPLWGDLPPNTVARWEATARRALAALAEADIGWARLHLRDGLAVRRAAWPPGEWICLTPGNPAVPADRLWALPNRALAEANGGTAEVLPSITWCTGGRIVMGWSPTQIDLLATDWQIVPG